MRRLAVTLVGHAPDPPGPVRAFAGRATPDQPSRGRLDPITGTGDGSARREHAGGLTGAQHGPAPAAFRSDAAPLRAGSPDPPRSRGSAGSAGPDPSPAPVSARPTTQEGGVA
jgi:hypothetical protein